MQHSNRNIKSRKDYNKYNINYDFPQIYNVVYLFKNKSEIYPYGIKS